MLKPCAADLPAVPGNVIAMRRESSITTLAAAGAIGVDQVAAAFRFRNAYLITMDAKRESVGFSEYLSPGRPPASLQERRAVAAKDLQDARRLIGAYAYSLMLRVCGEGHIIADLYAGRRDRETHADILKIHLGMLARLWQK